MKNIIIITTFLLFIFYITGVFSHADFNIVNWNDEFRKGLGTGFIFVEIIFLAFYSASLDIKK